MIKEYQSLTPEQRQEQVRKAEEFFTYKDGWREKVRSFDGKWRLRPRNKGERAIEWLNIKGLRYFDKKTIQQIAQERNLGVGTIHRELQFTFFYYEPYIDSLYNKVLQLEYAGKSPEEIEKETGILPLGQKFLMEEPDDEIKKSNEEQDKWRQQHPQVPKLEKLEIEVTPEVKKGILWRSEYRGVTPGEFIGELLNYVFHSQK